MQMPTKAMTQLTMLVSHHTTIRSDETTRTKEELTHITKANLMSQQKTYKRVRLH